MRKPPLGELKIDKYLEKTYHRYYYSYENSDKPYYAVKYLDNKSAKVIFSDTKREIIVTYDYQTGKTYELPYDSETQFVKLIDDKKNRYTVEITPEELRFLNFFRKMTNKEQNELYSSLQDTLINFILNRNS